MILSVGQLLKFESHSEAILWIDRSNGIVFTIELNNKLAWPQQTSVDEIIEAVNTEVITITYPEIMDSVISEEALTDAEKKVRDRRMALIEDLVNREPVIFYPHIRGQLVQDSIVKHSCGHQIINQCLRLYWQGGKRKNALLPSFSNSGGKGKHRNSGGKPLGRKPIYSDIRRPAVSDRTRTIFKNAIELDWLANPKKKLTDVYNDMLARNFTEIFVIDPQGNPHFELLDTSQRPSFRQFDHYRKTEYPRKEQIIARVGPIHYAQRHRPILGSSVAHVSGPGSHYQIDATIADIYLVSRYHRREIVGRPVLYFVTDTFTSMITGLYVGFEGPSWVSAMQALANSVCGKVEYCAEFGIQITEADWPCMGLPEAIRGDRGEMAGTSINTFINAFGVRIENTPPYRPDLKGIVENRFHLIQERFKPYVSAFVLPDFKKRGGRDYRLDAVLDIYEFTQIIILCVLEHNNKRILSTYTKDADMISDQVLPIPLHLWEWGIINRTGKPRYCHENLAKVALMPTDKARVYPDGIHFKHCTYSCDRAWLEGWFDRARMDRSFPITVAYDLRCANNIYVWDDDRRGYSTCNLTEKSRGYAGMTFWEVEHSLHMDKKQALTFETTMHESRINTTAEITKIENTAEAKTRAAQDPTVSNASRTSGISANRRQERNRERHGKGGLMAENLQTTATSESTPLNSTTEFAYPSNLNWLRQQRDKQQRDETAEDDDDEH